MEKRTCAPSVSEIDSSRAAWMARKCFSPRQFIRPQFSVEGCWGRKLIWNSWLRFRWFILLEDFSSSVNIVAVLKDHVMNIEPRLLGVLRNPSNCPGGFVATRISSAITNCLAQLFERDAFFSAAINKA